MRCYPLSDYQRNFAIAVCLDSLLIGQVFERDGLPSQCLGDHHIQCFDELWGVGLLTDYQRNPEIAVCLGSLLIDQAFERNGLPSQRLEGQYIPYLDGSLRVGLYLRFEIEMLFVSLRSMLNFLTQNQQLTVDCLMVEDSVAQNAHCSEQKEDCERFLLLRQLRFCLSGDFAIAQ